MNLKRVAVVGSAGLLGILASAPGVLAEVNTTAIESSLNLIYVFLPLILAFVAIGYVLGLLFGLFDKTF